MTPDLFFAAVFAAFAIRLSGVAYRAIPGWLDHLTFVDTILLLFAVGYCLLIAARLTWRVGAYLAKHVRWEP